MPAQFLDHEGQDMKLRENPAPPDALVTWACRFVEGVRWAADRPWFQAPPPALDVKHWEYRCRCLRAPVRVGRFPCDRGRDYLYLGQCPHCETIIWSYRHCHEIKELAA
jgi:hypothetical protein